MSRLTSVVAPLVAASLVAHGAASRTGQTLTAQGKQSICGSPEIWNILSVDSTVEGVRGIKWSKIVAKADDHISTKKAEMKVLEAEIAGLDESIAAALEQEKAQPTTEDQLKELINAGVAAFGNVADAQSSMCGKPPMKPRHPRGTYRKSQEAFKGAATAFFTGEFRLAGDFLSICKSMLVGSQPTDGNYCVQLCQIYMDTAQELSDESVGSVGGTTSDELIKKRAAAVEAHSAAENAVAACASSREAFASLKEKIEGLRDTVDKRFYAVQDAEYDLLDARADLGDLEELIQGEGAALADAMKVLAEAGINVADAKEALKDARDTEAALETLVKETDESLEKVQQGLSSAKNADKIIEQLKMAVEAIAEKMYLLFDRQALQPVREIGIHEGLNLDEYFHKDVNSLRSAGVMRDAVGALDGFCKGEAKASFDAVKGMIDLSPLCQIGEPAEIKTGVVKAVDARVATVKETLTRVMSWMDPYKGQHTVTPEMLKDFQKKGEPIGLRKTVGVYDHSGFFSKYLKEWTVHGDFLARIARLKAVIDELAMNVSNLKDRLAHFKAKLVEAMKVREAARDKLEQAVNAQGLAESSKEALQTKLREMNEQGVAMQKKIDEYERALADALKRYEEAQRNLVATYTEATSFLETLPDEEPVEMLESTSAQALVEVQSLREELKSAQMHFAEIEARLTAATAH